MPIALLSMLLLGPLLFDGAVEGTVRDEAGRPLPGANVVVARTGRGAAADRDGRFRIERIPAGPQRVAASLLGFGRVEREVVVPEGGAVRVDFVLREVALEPGEVVVTAARRAERALGAPATVEVVSAREIAVRQSTTLADALRHVPGVQVMENQVNVRGASGFSYNAGSRTLLLVDGVPLLGPERGGVPLTALPLAQVERIEVLKGPGSALYGSGALGGVVHLLTRDAPARPETMLRAWGGAYLPVRHAVWRRGWDEADRARPLGGLTATHARRIGPRLGGWLHLDAYRDEGYTRFHVQESAQAYGKLAWQPGGGLRLALLGGFTHRKADAFLYWNGARDPLSPGRLPLLSDGITGTNDNQTRQTALFPTFTHVLSGRLAYTLRARYFRLVIRPLDDDRRPKPVDDGTRGYRAGADLQVDLRPSPRRAFTLGAAGDLNAARSSFFPATDSGDLVRGQPEAALFGQWEERLSSHLQLVGGLRLDAYWIDEAARTTRLSPKLSAVFVPGGEDGATALRVAAGRGFRVPSLAERFTNDQSFFPVSPNLGLRPETSTGYELGVRTHRPLGRLTTRLDVALFWNEFEDLVEPRFVADVAGGDPGFQFVNLTRARIRGAEASVEADGGARLAARLAYTYLDADDLTEGTPLVFRSRHLATASLDAGLWGPLRAGADLRFAARPDRLDSDFTRFVPDADLLVPVRVVDVRLAAERGPLRAALLVKNALDYYYLERPAYLAPPRHVLLQLQMDL